MCVIEQDYIIMSILEILDHMATIENMWSLWDFTYTVKICEPINNVQMFPFWSLRDDELLSLLWLEIYPIFLGIYRRGEKKDAPRALIPKFKNIIYGPLQTYSHIQHWLQAFRTSYKSCKTNLFLYSLATLLEKNVVSYSIQEKKQEDHYSITCPVNPRAVLCIDIHMKHPCVKSIYFQFRRNSPFHPLDTLDTPECLIKYDCPWAPRRKGVHLFVNNYNSKMPIVLLDRQTGRYTKYNTPW